MICRRFIQAVAGNTELCRLLKLATAVPLLLTTQLLQAQSFSINVLPSGTQPLSEAEPRSAQADASSPLHFDAFDPAQLGPLLKEARARQEADEHLIALQVLKKAWHVSRVNNGLYHESQIPLLDSMIQSEIEIRDWAALDQHYSYMAHLYRRLYALDDPRLEEGLRKVSAFHVNALNINLDGKREYHLQQAAELFQLRLRVAELTLEEGHPRFQFLQEGLSISRQQLYMLSTPQQEQQWPSEERAALLSGLD